MAEPPDQPARRLVREALDRTLFVEAGAGSGKTTELVARVVALVSSGVPMAAIAAITFTEKAAAELRSRIRRELEVGAAAGSELHRVALDHLDGAAISTLHSFAQRLLAEHPIEAGLPAVEVLDEISSQLEFDDRWAGFVNELLDDASFERPFLLADVVGLGLNQLRDIAAAFGDNWDLVADRVPLDHPDPAPLDVSELIAAIDEVVELGRYCTDDENGLLVRLEELAHLARALEAVDDEIDRFRMLAYDFPAGSTRRLGRKDGWRDAACPIDRVRDAVTDLVGRRDAVVDVVSEACVGRMAAAVAAFTLAEARRRQESGRLEFHDLLVLARRMLRHPVVGSEVREAARQRYQRILLDEFQDTDPIQIELAVLLAADPSQPGDLPWNELEAEPGRLFFVGDPKQSIYRFRRADISLFLEAAGAFGDPPVSLSTNFRSTAPIVHWVNTVFSDLIAPVDGSQPEYVALAADRDAPPDGPSVSLLGHDAHAGELRADGCRDLEADDVVEAIRSAVVDGWSVSDGAGGWRPARLGDICILLPARTSLPQLERALEGAGIPYRAETSALVYATREIRDLLAVLRAVDDPTDQLSVATALRSPAFGCGDDDLYTYKVDHGGSWNHQADSPAGLPADHPVGEAMAWLAGLHRERHWLAPSAVVERVVRERRLMELAFAQGRPRDLWRRLRFVTDQARAYADATGGSLRDFLSWIRLQTAEGTRVAETVLPETDDESVRILTVHASKGLQFPVTIVSGLTTRPQRRRRGVAAVFPPDGTYGLRIHRDLVTEEFERFAPIDEQMDFHEKLRLLYVACTRAADHLVVSTHRKERATPESDLAKLTAAELIAGAAEPVTDETTRRRSTGDIVLMSSSDRTPVPDRDAWEAELSALLAEGRRARVVSATAAARVAAESIPGIEKEPRDLELPPWNKGRYGTAIGRAVHGVLQAADLSTGLVGAARAQAAAEGVADHAQLVEELAASALAAPTVVRAASRPHWKELYVGAACGSSILEGYIDLLFHDDRGLVVVDYKTDAVPEEALDHVVSRYRIQAAAYAVAVEEAIGEPVDRCVLVFCRPDGAIEREVDDLDAARDLARSIVEEGVAIGPPELE